MGKEVSDLQTYIWACCSTNDSGYLYHVCSQFSFKYCFSLLLLLLGCYNGIVGSCNLEHFLSEQTIQTYLRHSDVLFQGGFDSRSMLECPLRQGQEIGWEAGIGAERSGSKHAELLVLFSPLFLLPGDTNLCVCSSSLQKKLHSEVRLICQSTLRIKHWFKNRGKFVENKNLFSFSHQKHETKQALAHLQISSSYFPLQDQTNRALLVLQLLPRLT